MTADLLPCPFCGGESYLRDDASHSTAYFVGCSTEDCFGEIHWGQTADETIAAWNRRALPAVVPGVNGDFTASRVLVPEPMTRAKVESVIRIAASLFPGGYDNNHARICAAITEAGQ